MFSTIKKNACSDSNSYQLLLSLNGTQGVVTTITITRLLSQTFSIILKSC